MSGPKVIHYTVEQLAAMEEARNREQQRGRLRVAGREAQELAAELAAAHGTYDVSIPFQPVEASEDGDSGILLARVDRLEAEIARARDALATVRSTQRAARLAARLAAAAPIDLPAPARTRRAEPTPAAPHQEPIAARVERVLATLHGDVSADEQLLGLATAIRANDAGAEMALRALQAGVAQRNREHRERQQVLTRVRELAVRAEGLGAGATGLRHRIVAAQSALRAGDDAPVAELSAAVEAAEIIAAQERDAAYVADAVTRIFADLGYEAVAGFDTAVPEHGALVRKAGWQQHALVLDVADDEVHLKVVRTATESSATSRVRDKETEDDLCSDLPDLLDAMRRLDIDPDDVRSSPAGALKVQPLAGAPVATAKQEQTQQRKPQARAR